MAGSREERGGSQKLQWRHARGRRRKGAGTGADAALGLGEALRALLKAMGGTPERAGLQNLWDNWEAALGPELAALALPLGHHAARAGAEEGPGAGTPEAVLLLGAEDAMLLQELRFRGEEILARVNGFLGQAYFGSVQVSLPLGRRAPERSRGQEAGPAMGPELPQHVARGIFLAGMDEASPVARCYARFVGRHVATKGTEAEDEAGNGEKC